MTDRVTPEMREAGKVAARRLGLSDGDTQVSTVYLAMRALDPEMKGRVSKEYFEGYREGAKEIIADRERERNAYERALTEKEDAWFQLKEENRALRPVEDAAVAWRNARLPESPHDVGWFEIVRLAEQLSEAVRAFLARDGK